MDRNVQYPNLSELIKYHPYHISTFAGFANVTTGLLEAALRGEEELTSTEFFQIARYAAVPMRVLQCSKLIMLDKKNFRHKKMIGGLESLLYVIWEAQKSGSKEADMFMRYSGRINLVNLGSAFQDGRASYAQYLGVKESVEQTLSFIKNETTSSSTRGIIRKTT